MNDPKTVTDKILCSVQIKTKDGHCQPVELIVDTGSSVSILPESIYRKHFASCTLNPATVKLVSYSKEIIPVLGCFSTDVFHDGSTAMGTFYIVKSGSPLLGMDLLKALHCRIEGDAVITHENSEILPVHTVGCASGFVHKVKVKEGFIPVQQKLRRLPLSVRQAVSDELKHLLEQDIIERVDASPWVSPIVVTQKKGGGIRMCIDLREPNKAIVVDSHPLPHIEELLAELRGATVFSTIDLASAYHQVPLHPESRDLTMLN